MVEVNQREYQVDISQGVERFSVNKKDFVDIKNLAHYTSVDGFFGIINNQKFRMSGFDYMNDPGEFSFFIEVFCKALKNFHSDRGFNLEKKWSF